MTNESIVQKMMQPLKFKRDFNFNATTILLDIEGAMLIQSSELNNTLLFFASMYVKINPFL